MRYVLNVVYLLLLVCSSPSFLYSAIRYGKYRDGLKQKLFGLAPILEKVPHRIWFHAVSVGEVNLLGGLIDRLAEVRPEVEVVVSSTTQTGFGLAKQKYPKLVVFYCPLDFTWAVSNTVRRIKPTALTLVELELWPNLLSEANRRGIPISVVNGRLSDRSIRGYVRLGSLMRKWMSNLQLVTAQSEKCAARFIQLGVPYNRVHAVGSMKFDGAKSDRNNAQTRRFAELFQLSHHDLVFVAGSTQAPEEAVAISVFQRLSGTFPQLRLIIVPRHPERGEEVATLLSQRNVDWIRRSQLDDVAFQERRRQASQSPAKVLLVDRVGELGGWWGCAQIAYVGGSMGSRGGQNMIEPSAFGVATCFGPNTRNFRDIVEQLLHGNAAQVVHDQESLYQFVKHCLEDESFRTGLGRRAQQLVLGQRGSTDVTFQLLCGTCLKSVELWQHSVEEAEKSAAFPQSNDPGNPRRRRA